MFSSWFQAPEKPTSLTALYYDRIELAQELKSSIDSGKHILLYGPPRQGKARQDNTSSTCNRISDDYHFVCF